jgi:thiol-disulfide isomerase/thioredoxin
LLGGGPLKLRIIPIAGALLGLALCTFARATDIDLSAYRGKVVYLDFWASWCAPCRQSFPWMTDLVRKYGAPNLVVIAVNVDQDRQLAERFLYDNPAIFPIVYDPRGDIATTYKLVGMPSSILIDRTGRVRYRHTGFFLKDRDLYADQLRTLINEIAH